ncbi:MAG: methyltransferase [Bacteroidota bacterium]|nr:methyltransferase [Bacteroidota bacterium]
MTASRSIRKLFRVALNLFYRPYVLRRIRRPEKIVFRGCEIQTHPSVFHPALFFSTGILITSLEKIPLRGKSFLDMGTGTGVVGIAAARQGAKVTSCDVNRTAVELAQRNASRNSVQIELRCSDLFSNLNGELFDVIAFNIPFFPRQPRSDFEEAFNAGESFSVVKRFARESLQHLNNEGVVVIVFSEDSGYEMITGFFLDEGFHILKSAIRSKMFEKFYVVTFARKR